VKTQIPLAGLDVGSVFGCRDLLLGDARATGFGVLGAILGNARATGWVLGFMSLGSIEVRVSLACFLRLASPYDYEA
jgi:hypothetical protein